MKYKVLTAKLDRLKTMGYLESEILQFSLATGAG